MRLVHLVEGQLGAKDFPGLGGDLAFGHRAAEGDIANVLKFDARLKNAADSRARTVGGDDQIGV